MCTKKARWIRSQRREQRGALQKFLSSPGIALAQQTHGAPRLAAQDLALGQCPLLCFLCEIRTNYHLYCPDEMELRDAHRKNRLPALQKQKKQEVWLRIIWLFGWCRGWSAMICNLDNFEVSKSCHRKNYCRVNDWYFIILVYWGSMPLTVPHLYLHYNNIHNFTNFRITIVVKFMELLNIYNMNKISRHLKCTLVVCKVNKFILKLTKMFEKWLI